MKPWRRNLVIVWVSQFLGLSGFFFTMPFIPYYIQHLGVSDPAHVRLWVAFYTVAGYASIAIVAPFWGVLADRYGRKPMLLRALFSNAVIITLMGATPNVLVLVALRCLMGVFSGSSNASQTLVASLTPKHSRGLALGLLSSSIFAGTLFGSFLGGVIVDAFGFQAAFFACGAIFLISGLLVLFGVREEFQPPVRRKTGIRGRKHLFLGIDLRPLRWTWLLLVLILLMAMARKFDEPYLPLLVQELHGTLHGAATLTGLISGITAIAGILAGPMLGWLADRVGAPRVAVCSALLAGLCMVPHGLATGFPTLVTARFMMVFFAGGLDPVFQVWLAKSTPDKIRGIVFGWALTARCMGWMLAAMFSGGIAAFIGLRWIYAGSALLYLLLIPMIRYTTPRVRGRGRMR